MPRACGLLVRCRAGRAAFGRAAVMTASGHSLHFGSVSMSGLPPTTTEWRTFEDGRNVPGPDSCTATRLHYLIISSATACHPMAIQDHPTLYRPETLPLSPRLAKRNN
jgi:hypothetical protein